MLPRAKPDLSRMPIHGPLILCAAVAFAGPSDDDRAVVIAEALDVFSAPSGSAYSTGQLREGEVVVVRARQDDGWVAIAPPDGSFEWIDETALDLRDGKVALVTAGRATLRSGRAGARMPGPPSVTLDRGTAVRLVEREPLSLRQGRSTRTWRAVEPPEGLLRYVRADGLDPGKTAAPPRRVRPASAPLRIDPSLFSAGPAIDPTVLPPEHAGAIARIEEEHRRILRGPIESWNLQRVIQGYQALQGRVNDAAARVALDGRLAKAENQARAAAAAREFAEILQRSRRRDGQQRALEEKQAASPTEDRPFDAVGLLQPSSKLVEGERVYMLIGPEGRSVAYLRPAPGVLVRPLVGRRVGARGTVRYDEYLRAEVIQVLTLEALAEAP
jgi:hypothetical protein